jgi:hypothetical protein
MPSNLVDLIQMDLGFEEGLEKFKGSFEWDEIMDIYNVEKKFEKFNFFSLQFYYF